MSDDKVTAYLAEVEQRCDTASHATWQDYATALELLGGALRSLADVSRLLTAVRAVLDLHQPFGIYDDCGHEHTTQEVIEGDAIDTGLFYACPNSLMYRICTECCTVGMEQTENCASEHDHGPGKPFCRTHDAIAKALLGEGGTDDR